MIIVGKLIFSSRESDEEKHKIEKEKKKNRCSVSMLRDFALVVMVMPCGLTPVEGIDFVDWFYFSMYACAHVRPTQTHTQCTVRCLWRMVAYWTSASASEKNIAIPHEQTVWSTSTGPCWRRGRRSYNLLGTTRPLSPREKEQHGEAFNLSWLLAG